MRNPNLDQSKTNERGLNEARLNILDYLAEHRFATTGQLNQELQSDKDRTHLLGDLRWLRKAGMIRNFAIEPEKGSTSEYGWLLAPNGAEALRLENYGTHYARIPSREKIKRREMELDLIRSLRFASDTCELEGGSGWLLIEPLAYSSSRPLPGTTPQYQKLVEAIDFMVAGKVKTSLDQGTLTLSGQTVTSFKQAQQRLAIPKQVNDYVVYLSLENVTQPVLQTQLTNLKSWAATLSSDYVKLPIRATLAFLVILCPPGTGEKFWLARLNRYARLAKYLTVYGVFDRTEDQQSAERLLVNLARKEKHHWKLNGHGANLRTIRLADFYNLLERTTNQLSTSGFNSYLALPEGQPNLQEIS